MDTVGPLTTLQENINMLTAEIAAQVAKWTAHNAKQVGREKPVPYDTSILTWLKDYQKDLLVLWMQSTRPLEMVRQAVREALDIENTAREHALDRMWERLECATFAILVESNYNVGIAFAVTTRHLLTVWHNLSEEQIQRKMAVQLLPMRSNSSAAAPLMIDAMFTDGDKVQDWAVLRVSNPALQLTPALIFKGTLDCKLLSDVTLVNVDIGLNDETEQLQPTFSVVQAKICSLSTTTFGYTAASFIGDSEDPIIITKSGHVCGMHVRQVKKMLDESSPCRKRAKVDETQERRSSFSGSTAHETEALRIDVIRNRLEKMCAPFRLMYE